MKTILLFLLIASSYTASSQEYKVVKKITNKCSTIFNGESFGLLYDKQIVQEMEYSGYDVGDGLIVFNKELASVCWNANGEQILKFTDANMSLTEDNDYLMITKGEKQQALYSKTGKEIIPFGPYEFDFYEEGVLVKDSSGREAFFNDYGREILPFDNKRITVIDDYGEVLAVNDHGTNRMLANDMVSNPIGFNWFSDYAFASNHEVTIEEYLYFLGSQKSEGYLLSKDLTQPISISELLPDTNKIESKFLPLYCSVFPLLLSEDAIQYKTKIKFPLSWAVNLYMPFKLDKNLKKLAQFPVTGITKEQAEAYCNWLSMICSEYSNRYTYDGEAVFRLPTENEWQDIAYSGLYHDEKEDNMPDSISQENCMRFVYKSSVECKNYPRYLKASRGGGSIPSKSVPIDYENRNQVFGNVAEMTSEAGIAKGGSYAHSAKAANLKNDILYSSPEPWLGFRIVGEYHY